MDAAAFDSLLGRAVAPLAHRRVDGRTWTLAPAPPQGTEVHVDIAGAWARLQCVAPTAKPGGDGPAAAGTLPTLCTLAAQSSWPGGVKRIESGPAATLRCDVPLVADTAAGREWIARQLRLCFDGLVCVAGIGAPETAAAGDESTAVADDPQWLAYACTAAGRDAAVKADGTVRIDVALPGVGRTVVLAPRAGALRASLVLASPGPAAAHPACRDAAALLLTRACAALRWARVFAEQDGDRLAGAGFECLIATPAEEGALLHAVDTLVAAADLFGREAELLLADVHVASRYLQVRNAPSARVGAGPPNTSVATPSPDAAPAAPFPLAAAAAA